MKPSVLCFCVLASGITRMLAEQHHTSFKSDPSSCNVTGLWRSGLGSMLQLVSTGQELRGVYHTAVETVPGASGRNREAKVVGVIGEGPQPNIAFSVVWVKGSCSAWVGQCFLQPDGARLLKTLWMLRSAAENSFDNWGSTRLGEDQFIFMGDVESAKGC